MPMEYLFGVSSLIFISLVLGVRHGFDWDHIAAITDLAATEQRKKGFILAICYAIGHEIIIFVLGSLAVAFGWTLPNAVDNMMEKFVGLTLIVLSGFVLYALFRKNGDNLMVSRWRMLYTAYYRVVAWVSEKFFGKYRPVDSTLNINMTYKGAVVIGLIHGIGATTPTQLILFTAAAGAGTPLQGMMAVGAFAAGLMVTHTILAFVSIIGFSALLQRKFVYRSLALLTCAYSLFLGILYITGTGYILPELS